MSGTSESQGNQGDQGSQAPNGSTVPVAPAQNDSPNPHANLGDLAHPWTRTCPKPLRPWLDLRSPCQDPWSMAEQSGLLFGNQEYRQWSQDPGMRQQASIITSLREGLAVKAHATLVSAWAKRSESLQTLPAPTIPREVARLLPPQADLILEEAWKECLRAMLWREWKQGPTSKWAMEAILPPFAAPELAPIPVSPVSPGPEVWLAWTSPVPGRVEPLLILGTHPPMAGELPELRHRDSGVIVVPPVVGTAMSLEQPRTESIIRAMAHYGGVWVDETSAES